MNQLNHAILEILEQDARTTPAQIAVMLDEEETSVKQAVEQMEKDEVLLKYTTVVNEEKTGSDESSVRALIEVRIMPERDYGFDAIANRIARFNEVRTMYLMSGTYDLLVILDGSSIREVSQFVARKLSPIEGVLGTTTHFILKRYKDRGVCFEQEETDSRLKVTP